MLKGWSPSIFARLVLVIVLGGCGGGSKGSMSAHQSSDPVQACNDWVRTTCMREEVCLAEIVALDAGVDPARVEACIKDYESANGTCQAQIASDPCFAKQAKALNRCSETIENEACSSVCRGTDFIFCYNPCFYLCG